MTKITKAVFPVAGLGTRFLPATKAMPKELLPIIDKPIVQFAVEEAIAAGITELIFVTGRNKRAVGDHFDANLELEAQLNSQRQNRDCARHGAQHRARRAFRAFSCAIPEPLGLGHAGANVPHRPGGVDKPPLRCVLSRGMYLMQGTGLLTRRIGCGPMPKKGSNHFVRVRS